MLLGKVVGTIVSTTKEESLVGHKLMIVNAITEKYEMLNRIDVAVDSVGAGIGDVVIITTGSSARRATGKLDSSVNATIVGIVDTIETIN